MIVWVVEVNGEVDITVSTLTDLLIFILAGNPVINASGGD